MPFAAALRQSLEDRRANYLPSSGVGTAWRTCLTGIF